MAIEMLRRVEAGALPLCSNCRREFRNQASERGGRHGAEDRQRSSIGGWLCKQCLRSGDPLETLASAFGRIAPGMQVEAVQ